MTEKAGSSRIFTTKPRSESISDVRKFDVSTMKETPFKSSAADEVYVQELSGVFLKRVPVTVPLSDGQGTIPSYDYHVENKRDYKVRVVMEFKGTNVRVTAARHATQVSHLVVEGLLGRDVNANFATVTSYDGKNDFSFTAEIKVFPDQEDIRVADLEGVKLFTIVTYNDLVTVMHFEAENTKEFDVEVELELKGHLLEQSSPLPFSKVVRSGQKIFLGYAKSNVEIESGWKWQQIVDPSAIAPGATVSGKKITQTSELKGVTLKQTMTPGDPTLIEFEIVNGRNKKIAVSIDLEGDGFINFQHQSRPLVGEIFPYQTAFIGVVEIRGDATVNWKYKEVE